MKKHWQEIIAASCSACDVKEEQLKTTGRRSTQSVAEARAIAAMLLRNRCGLTLHRIAEAVGYRAHSSAEHALTEGTTQLEIGNRTFSHRYQTAARKVEVLA